jgi:periplasmic mercuric ion binding protein
MKKLILITLMILPFIALAQGNFKKAEFRVSGNCDMCKNRIEKAATMEGVKSATWSVETKMLTVEYDENKVKLDDIHKKVAEAGHDTDKMKAADNVYNNLPACCRYERTSNRTGQAAPGSGRSCCGS